MLRKHAEHYNSTAFSRLLPLEIYCEISLL